MSWNSRLKRPPCGSRALRCAATSSWSFHSWTITSRRRPAPGRGPGSQGRSWSSFKPGISRGKAAHGFSPLIGDQVLRGSSRRAARTAGLRGRAMRAPPAMPRRKWALPWFQSDTASGEINEAHGSPHGSKISFPAGPRRLRGEAAIVLRRVQQVGIDVEITRDHAFGAVTARAMPRAPERD